jgi:hypothetical protein
MTYHNGKWFCGGTITLAFYLWVSQCKVCHTETSLVGIDDVAEHSTLMAP